MPRIIIITGTDTGAGKTVLSALLARYLSDAGQSVAAVKPICSGGRDDARALRAACSNQLTLDEVNPWHFRASLAPVLAARKEGKAVTLKDIAAHVRVLAHRFHFILVEGAGGLLSPLGEHFSTRELIAVLGSDVFIAARNQLGVVNHVRLTLEALPPLLRLRARVVLMSPRREDAPSKTNPALLGEFMPPEHIVVLPWLARPLNVEAALKVEHTRDALSALLH